jgi:hypothetical protein
MPVCTPNMNNKDHVEEKPDCEANFSVYVEYMKTLRIWLVAYGIGGPVLFITQSSISTKILESGYARWIVVLFFIGVIFQIIIAILNKYVNWYLYCYADSKDRINPKIYECCEKISTKIFIDITCDVISICSFICSTIWVLWICTTPLSKT